MQEPENCGLNVVFGLLQLISTDVQGAFQTYTVVGDYFDTMKTTFYFRFVFELQVYG